MKVAVWDTYVTKKDGSIMHFDIIADEKIKDEKKIFSFGEDYLTSKSQQQQPMTSKECRFCHIEEATPEMNQAIEEMWWQYSLVFIGALLFDIVPFPFLPVFIDFAKFYHFFFNLSLIGMEL